MLALAKHIQRLMQHCSHYSLLDSLQGSFCARDQNCCTMLLKNGAAHWRCHDVRARSGAELRFPESMAKGSSAGLT